MKRAAQRRAARMFLFDRALYPCYQRHAAIERMPYIRMLIFSEQERKLILSNEHRPIDKELRVGIPFAQSYVRVIAAALLVRG